MAVGYDPALPGARDLAMRLYGFALAPDERTLAHPDWADRHGLREALLPIVREAAAKALGERDPGTPMRRELDAAADDTAAAGDGDETGQPWTARTPPRIALPARAPNTNPSSSELLASRFAPCTPVHAASPAANRPGTPTAAAVSGSTSTPPMT